LMNGIGGLGSPHLQEDPFDAFIHGRSGSPLKEFNVGSADDRGFAAFSKSGLGGLIAYIEDKLELGAGQPDGMEIDFQGAAELMFTLGTEMGNHIDMAVWAQRQVNPNRAVSLLY